jgi:hypothetical protein
MHIMKVARQSPLRIHDYVDEFPVYYLHYECASFIAKCLHEENSMATPTSGMHCRMSNL